MFRPKVYIFLLVLRPSRLFPDWIIRTLLSSSVAPFSQAPWACQRPVFTPVRKCQIVVPYVSIVMLAVGRREETGERNYSSLWWLSSWLQCDLLLLASDVLTSWHRSHNYWDKLIRQLFSLPNSVSKCNANAFSGVTGEVCGQRDAICIHVIGLVQMSHLWILSLSENLLVTHQVNQFLLIYESIMFITLLATSEHWFMAWASLIQSTHSSHIRLKISAISSVPEVPKKTNKLRGP
jgi:hypothetical protein